MFREKLSLEKKKGYRGPLPITTYGALKQIKISYEKKKKPFKPAFKQRGEEVHTDLKGITFHYWLSLDEEVCAMSIKDRRTSLQKQKSQWALNIRAEVFRNLGDARAWLASEVKKYCDIVGTKY